MTPRTYEIFALATFLTGMLCVVVAFITLL